MTHARAEIAVVGSGFAGALASRILARLGYDVVLIERGRHPRFAIGESTTPLANLSLERIARRYAFADCWRLAAHGRWREHYPQLRCGLKRGFTFLRHQPGVSFENRGVDSERLLVAASPDDAVADTHWRRADVDQHFVGEAIAAGVYYLDETHLERVAKHAGGMRLTGMRADVPVTVDARFVIDASGPSGFLARGLAIASSPATPRTESALVYGHLAGTRRIADVLPGLPAGPYADDAGAVHHLVDEGWIYALRFEDGVTSAGALLTPAGLRSLHRTARLSSGMDGRARRVTEGPDGASALWFTLLGRYPALDALFSDAAVEQPLRFVPRVQHCLTISVGDGWAMLPHTYAFVDPLFSTGIAWSLLGVERLALAFEEAAGTANRLPDRAALDRYGALLAAEASQIDHLVAAAYLAMPRFALFAAVAMIYFATASYAEVERRIHARDGVAWEGFLGVDDPILASLPAAALERLSAMRVGVHSSSPAARREDAAFASWIAEAIAPRNVAGVADPARHNLYPVDLDVLVDRHALLGLTREQLLQSVPALRGRAPEPTFLSRV